MTFFEKKNKTTEKNNPFGVRKLKTFGKKTSNAIILGHSRG